MLPLAWPEMAFMHPLSNLDRDVSLPISCHQERVTLFFYELGNGSKRWGLAFFLGAVHGNLTRNMLKSGRVPKIQTKL